MDDAPARPDVTMAAVVTDQGARIAALEAQMQALTALLTPPPGDDPLLEVIAQLVEPDEVFGSAEIIDRATLAPSLMAELRERLPGDPGTLGQRLGQALARISERGGAGRYRLQRLPAAGHAAQYALEVAEASGS